MKFLRTPLLLAATLLVFAACERDDMELDQAEAASAISEGEVNTFFDDIDLMVTEAVSRSENGRVAATTGYIPACAVVSHNTTTRTTIIDFGTGCTDGRGNVRKGKIMISRSGGTYFENGSSSMTNLEGYSINGIEVNGIRTVTNTTPANAENLQFSVVLSYGRVNWPDGTYAERNVDHVRTWVRASLPANDEWHVTGAANGRNRNGQVYNSNISDALVVKIACRAEGTFIPVEGSVFVDRPDKPVIVVDYGSGTCDNQVTVSMNGRNRTLTVSQ